MADSISVNTNGKHKVSWITIVGVLWSLFLGLLTWTATRELDRSETRLTALEQSSSTIQVTSKLREEDKRLLDKIVAEQERQGKMLAAIAARLNVREDER